MKNSIRKKLNLNEGWFFTREKKNEGSFDAYQLTKTGNTIGPAAMSYDDHNWQIVNLPHDFVVNQDLDADQDNYNGYLKRSDCWYRKYFYLPDDTENKRIILHFGGISGKSEIYFNGCLLKRNESSFCGIDLDISDYVHTGKNVNVLAVFMNHQYPEGWWYQGGGLYRQVWMEIMEPVCFDDSKLRIVTQKLADDIWEAAVSVPVIERWGETKKVKIEAYIENEPDTVELTAQSGEVISMKLKVQSPRLWHIGEGNLYTLVMRAKTSDGMIDVISQKFGFREIMFHADEGFGINGEYEKIRGLCFHEDEGNLGWAIDRSVYERRLHQLIDMGGNAYRCSHNAPDPDLLDLCDEYGILVMDETRKFDSGESAMQELEYLVCRDRNHPSVILWSLGNEETLQGTVNGRKIACSMKMLVDKLDGTRPVTLAMHQDFNLGGAADVVDVLGVNYNHDKIMEIREKYPEKPFIGSEILNLADEIIENGSAVPGSVGAYETLKFAETHSFYAGTFGWAGADYRGEHRNLAFFTDACPLNCNGNRKDGFYRYQARWGKEPVLHICGHWNPDSYARNLPDERRSVRIISNLPYVKIYINDNLTEEIEMDDQQQKELRLVFSPGVIRAEGYYKKDEKEFPVIIDEIKTSGLAHHFRIFPEQKSCPADGISNVTCWIEIKDKDGIHVPMAAHNFRVDCEGDAEILCTDNADPYCSCFPDVHEMGLYKGRGKVVLKAGKSPGKIRITVTGEGIEPAECEIVQTKVNDLAEEVEMAYSPFVNDWFVSRVYEKKPDIYEYTTDDNYSIWRKSLERASMVEKDLPFFYTRGGGYVIYCMEPNMPKLKNGEIGKVVFEEITGSCEILISMRDYDNRILKRFYLSSDEEHPRTLGIELPGVVSDDRLIIKVVVKGTHSKCGVTGPVRFG